MRAMGVALWAAQIGSKSPAAKPLKGDTAFKGAGVLEVVEDFSTDTYRVVYTVKFADVVYVLHAFQKKSKSGISTPKNDIDKIKRRLKTARDHHAEHYAQPKTK